MSDRKFLFLFAAVLLFAALFSGCTRVEPGYAGIEVHNYGDQKGVEDFPIQVGRVWYNPFVTDVYKFPTFTQTSVWTQAKTEGSPNDDSITFADKKGVVFNADVALSYRFIRERVPHIFVTFRQDVEQITNIYMRNKVREAYNRAGSQYEAMEIVGDKKPEFEEKVLQELNKMLSPDIIFDTVTMVGAPRVDNKVQTAINEALEATQRAIRAENEIREREAEAKKKIADAEGEAESIRLRAEAEAEANREVAESLSPALVQYEAIKKWDGKLPQVSGESVPFINLKAQ